MNPSIRKAAEEYSTRKWSGRVARHKTIYAKDFSAGAEYILQKLRSELRNEGHKNSAALTAEQWAEWLKNKMSYCCAGCPDCKGVIVEEGELE